MLSKQDQQALRSILFKHLDGIGTAPTALALHKKGVLDFLLEQGKASLPDLAKHFDANEGYLNVALRILASQGWLIQHVDNAKDEISYSLSNKSEAAFSHINLYEEAVDLLRISDMFHPKLLTGETSRKLGRAFDNYRNNYGISISDDKSVSAVQAQILKHIEGVLVGPIAVHLGMNGMFHQYFMEASFRAEEFHSDPECFELILSFFAHLGWFEEANGTFRFTEMGLFFAKRASAYGVTVSYVPNFNHINDLLFGNPVVLRDTRVGEEEKHVDREMNVWGSGNAHSGYFKVVDEIIIDLFNKPIDQQPKGILDMGCGNGAFIEHIFNVIEKHTNRGPLLEQYPLFLVGADYNEAALRVTKQNLIKADIWAKVVWGDIGRPDILANTLKQDYNIDLQDLLNVRTFLDHNRIWKHPENIDESRNSSSTGAFVHRGERKANNLVEDSLLEHFKNWEPYVRDFGLLVIELHTIAPELAAANIGKSAATAYDATHGFSDQYIVEVDVFHKIATEAGLPPVEKYFRKFPNSELATVTVNLLRGD